MKGALTLGLALILALSLRLPAQQVVVFDHLDTPGIYENAHVPDFWGQTFTSEGWNVIGFDLLIDDPTRPDNPSVNELVGPVELRLYDVSDLQNPVLLASSTIGDANSVFSGLVSFDLSNEIATEAGKLYLFGLKAEDDFGIGLRAQRSSTYSGGGEAVIRGGAVDGEVLTGFDGRDFAFRIRRADSDSDGIPDNHETNTGTFLSPTDTGTDPNNPDTDGDGLTDGQEVLTYGTNPFEPDTDGDGFNDGAEIFTGKSPTDPAEKPDAVSNFYTSVEFEFFSENGATYRIEWSTDLEAWTPFPEIITGDGNAITRFYSTRVEPKRFFRAEKVGGE